MEEKLNRIRYKTQHALILFDKGQLTLTKTGQELESHSLAQCIKLISY